MRVLIADDHALFRQGVRSLIESFDGAYVVVGEASDGLQAVAKAVELLADVVLIDLCMPNQNGMEAVAAIVRRLPQAKVIVVTAHCSEEHVRATLAAGAHGYVLKDDTAEDLAKALEAVREGKIFLTPGICNRVVTGYLRQRDDSLTSTTPESESPRPSWSTLTTRERQMLKLVGEGKKNREMAVILSLSQKTVEKHRASLMRKMGFSTVAELVAFALANGLV